MTYGTPSIIFQIGLVAIYENINYNYSLLIIFNTHVYMRNVSSAGTITLSISDVLANPGLVAVRNLVHGWCILFIV